MKGFSIRFGVTVLSFVSFSFSSCFANSENIVYGLERAQNFQSQTEGNFYIQVAAFSHKSYAYRYQHRLQSLTEYPVKISHKRNLYIVLIGPMHSVHQLRNTASILWHSSSKKTLVRANPIINSTHTQSTSHVQHYAMPEKSSETVSSSVMKSSSAPTINSNANWFVAVGSGAEFPITNNTLHVNNGSLFPAPYDTDIYTTKQSASALVNFSIGHRWEHQDKWIPAFSLALLYQHSFLGNVRGTVTQYSLPEFTNYNYNWNLSSDILLASAKINFYAQNRFLPYVMVGIGGAFNHSHYSETALPGVTPRINPSFSGTSGQFAYNAGAGLDFRASNRFIVNVGYLYQNIGTMSGQGKGTWSDTSLRFGSYGLNEVLAGVTYLFDK